MISNKSKSIAIQTNPELSPTFCVYPWTYAMIGPTQDSVKLCCHSDWENPMKTELGEPYSYKTHTLDEIWNGKTMRGIRKKMLSGEKVANCKQCYLDESRGKISLRKLSNFLHLKEERYIKKEVIFNRVIDSVKNNYASQPPFILEMRIRNLCNLKCRMCDESSSSQIQKETKEIAKKNKKLANDFF